MTADGAASPFVGPRPFSAEDTDVFFGRDREVEKLTSLVISHPAVLLYAVSGAGKTSLLSAGLVPALAEQGFDVLPILGLRAPVEPPAEARNAYVFSALWRLSQPDGVSRERLPDADTTLAEALAALPRDTDRYGFPMPRLLIFDQFEEVFTLHMERWRDREGFFAQVGAALAEDPSLRVLFALREEYIAPLDRFGPLLPDGLRTRLHLERLRREAAVLAVKRPLERAGIAIEESVAETLVADLEQTRIDTGHGMAIVPGEFVEPVHLQVVCRTLWNRLAPGVKEVTRADLAVLGSVDDSLTAYYESAIAAAVARSRGREDRFREAFERAFITSAGTRATVFAGAQESGPLPAAALDELADRHLIRAEWRAGGRWLELAHDRLIEPIRRSNAVVRERVRRRRFLLAAVAAVTIAGLAGGAAALFVRDEAAPRVIRRTVVVGYPGDAAPREDKARWMATNAISARIPPELPVMAALTESGMENLNYGSSAGFFGMRKSIWNRGAYKGFPRKPQLQLDWFFDTAKAVRAQEIESGRPDPASSPRFYGRWIADVERPAEQYRGRYQLRLKEAQALTSRLLTQG